MLRDGLEEVRGFIATLRPPAVEVGLTTALRDAAAEFQARNGIAVHVEVDGIDAGLSPAARASVLRITQESLQNVRKHAAATEVRISLDGNRLVIADNGRGFDVMRLATGVTRNFGLQFMRERAELMGSELQIESRQGEGTRILLRLPEPSPLASGGGDKVKEEIVARAQAEAETDTTQDARQDRRDREGTAHRS